MLTLSGFFVASDAGFAASLFAVLADFVQLAPDRSAVLSIDPANPKTARVFVGGLTPEGPRPLRYAVTVERRMAGDRVGGARRDVAAAEPRGDAGDVDAGTGDP